MKRPWLWAPLGLFAALFAAFATGLFNPPDRAIQSRMVGRSVPAFALPGIASSQSKLALSGLTQSDLADGKPKLLNVFASWCVPCVAELPVLADLERQGVLIVGIAVQDRSDAVARFLEQHGNPYARIGLDTGSTTQIALGSAGVPETFVVDGAGIIRHQHIGVVTADNARALRLMLAKLK
jgi:cytochrome c biogenesis protein CcmG, thiol:disulfide interchange protein DsbE